MMRTLLLALALAGSAPAQFAEIDVDAASAQGEIRPTFGIDAPEDETQARLLLANGVELPVRAGPRAALRDRLAETLPAVFLDGEARPAVDVRRHPPAVPGACVWGRTPLPSPEEAVAAAMHLQDTAATSAYYDCHGDACFAADGGPSALIAAMELGARMSATPRRLGTRAGAKTGIEGLAGVSEDGETVQVLLSRLLLSGGERPAGSPPAPESYVLYVRNLPWGAQPFRIERYRFDGRRPTAPTATGAGRGGLARISAPLSPPAIELIVLRRADKAPGADILLRRNRTAP